MYSVLNCHNVGKHQVLSPIVMFLTLQWNSLGRASFEVHESQHNVHLRKLVFKMLLCGVTKKVTLKSIQTIHRSTPFGWR
jgi:hypothetical protein